RLTTAANDAEELSLVNTVNARTVSASSAPTGAALTAAYTSTNSLLTSQPKNAAIVTLIMASEPSSCNPLSTPAALAGLASGELATYGVKTFVIGVGSQVSWSTINGIAVAGGGKAYAIAADGSLAQNLTSALAAIRGSISACSFEL